MTCTGVKNKVIFDIEIDICRGDEILGELSRESLVQSRENLARLRSVIDLGSKGHLKHRSDESGRKTMSGNVGDEDTEMSVVDVDEVIEVSPYGCHWME